MKVKRIIAIAVAAVALVSIATAGALALARPAQGLPEDSAANQRTVSVSGSAQVTLEPDIATIDFGVQTANAATVSAGRDANNALMNKVYDALKAQGVDTKDVKTVNYSINPRYSADGKTVTGYDVLNSVEVTVRDLGKLGSVMDAVASAGANEISGLSFSVADSSAAYNEALKKAVADAHTRAATLAGKAGATLGAVVSASESGYTPITPIYYDRGMAAGAAMATPVSSGSLTVSAAVSVVYELD